MADVTRMADAKGIHTQMLASDLRAVVADAEKVLRSYGIKTWRLTLVVRHPRNAEEFVITGDDDHAEVAALLAKHP